jgi:predicted DCC family thiol-disulfide oxidoreductase YuxK
VLRYLAPADYLDLPVISLAVLNLAAGIAVLAGFLCQYALIFLVLVEWQYGDAVLGTSTLGNYVAAMLGVLLFLVNGGRNLSVDGWVLKRFPRLRRPLLYYAGAPTSASMTAAKWLGLFSFWLVCVYSLAMHLDEPAWRSGTAGPLLLSNNFMSSHYEILGDLFTDHQWAVVLARLSMWSMLPWYALLVPCVLIGSIARVNRVIRFIALVYAIGWGILFFVFSILLLNLSWLAEIELLLWAAIFWSRTGITTPQRFSVVFDDRSRLCDRTVHFVRVVDVFDRVRFVAAGENPDWPQSHEVNDQQAMADPHGVDDVTGRAVSGYDVFVELSRQVVLLWPGYPILLIGKWSGLGPVTYRWIARRRPAERLQPSRKRAEPSPEPSAEGTGGDRAQRTFVQAVSVHVALLSVFYLVAIPAPYIGFPGWQNPLADTARIYGLGPINVFNATDLGMAENWFTLSLLTGDHESLMPILAEDGSRLSYHASDRVYFGETLPWRRRHIGQPGCFFDQDQDQMRYLASIYLSKQELPRGEYRVRYRQYFQALPDSGQVARNRYVRQPSEVRCTVDFTVHQP